MESHDLHQILWRSRRISRDLLNYGGVYTGSVEITPDIWVWFQITHGFEKVRVIIDGGEEIGVEEAWIIGRVGFFGFSDYQTENRTDLVSFRHQLSAVNWPIAWIEQIDQSAWVVDNPKFNISLSNTTTSSTQNQKPRPNLHKLKKMFTIHNNLEKSISNTYLNQHQVKKKKPEPNLLNS